MRRIILSAMLVGAMACAVRAQEPAEWLRQIESLSVRPTPMTDWWVPRSPDWERFTPERWAHAADRLAVVSAMREPAKSFLDPEIIPIELRDF
jgi:hypothetical protein